MSISDPMMIHVYIWWYLNFNSFLSPKELEMLLVYIPWFINKQPQLPRPRWDPQHVIVGTEE